MERRVCTTQSEVDAAAAAGDLIVIDSTWRGSSRAVLWESSSAVLWESSSAELRGSSRAVLRGSSSAVLWESSSAVLWESSSAVLRGSSRAVLRGSSSAELWGSSSAVLRGSRVGARMIGPDVSVTGRTDRGYRIDTAEAWADYCGLDVVDGHVELYKAVDTDGSGGSGYGPGVTYEVGVETVAPDWDPDWTGQCGRGLHLSPSAAQARCYHRQAVAVLACRVALEDIAVHEACLDKVRVRACTPIRVVWTAEDGES